MLRGFVRLQEGQLYNTEDGRKALRDIFALQLFDNVQVFPRQNPKDEAKIDVDIMVKERPMRTAELECEWAIAPDEGGKPGLVSIIPGLCPASSTCVPNSQSVCNTCMARSTCP